LVISSKLAYLDSSALVKLIAVEPETGVLRSELTRWPHRVSSLLAVVEVVRTAQRLGPQATALAPRVLAGVRLLAIDPIILAAARIGGPLGSLNAIHLATAVALGDELGALITYDQGMLNDAPTLGLPVLCPR
jgi:predicted nucleic acid-binding protein